VQESTWTAAITCGGIVPSGQNPVADTSQARELEVDPGKAKLWLDDPTLDRIIDAVGPDRPDGLDRDMLRRDLLICYGRYSIASGPDPQNARLGSMQKHARRLIDLLKDDDADLGLICAIWPIDTEHPAHLLSQLVDFDEVIDRLTQAILTAQAKAHLSTSPLQQLTGAWLPEVYTKHFDKKAGRSRRLADGAVGGPYIRFAHQMLAEAGIKCSDETIARYMGFSAKK
jgi:hypothetical protein